MRAPMIFILSFAAIALSGCGQINNASPTVKVQGVGSSGASNFIPSTPSGGSTSTNSGTSSPITGSTSSSPPTLSGDADNGGSSTLGIGNSVTFVAPFQPDASLTYQWYKNGAKISGATSSAYSLNSITATDYAVYYVKATNSMGTATSGAFTLNPILMLATLGSHDCNGYQCWNDATTAAKVCKMRFGEQSVMYNQYAFGTSGIKWTTQFCSWNGSDWSCQSNCKADCSAYAVLGYVYCLQ